MKQNEQLVVGGDNTVMSAGNQGKLVELEFAGYCAFYLSKIYPGHWWPVECHESEQGMDVRIRHLAMQNFPNYCYYIAPQDNISPTSLHQLLMIGGGELLERLGLQRNRAWDGTVATHMADIRKNKKR
jgi:hypothetical protein